MDTSHQLSEGVAPAISVTSHQTMLLTSRTLMCMPAHASPLRRAVSGSGQEKAGDALIDDISKPLRLRVKKGLTLPKNENYWRSPPLPNRER
jgi:hypothetical protein